MTKLKFENLVFARGMQQTIRKGKKPVCGNFFRITSKAGVDLDQAIVYEQETYFFSEIPDNVIAMSHDPECRTADGLLKAMKHYYPDFDEVNEVVTVVWFKLLPAIRKVND